MPSQTRGFWSCDSCGASFDTLGQAKDHEAGQCQRRQSLHTASVGGKASVPPSHVTPPAPAPGAGVSSLTSRLPQPPMPPQHYAHLQKSHHPYPHSAPPQPYHSYAPPSAYHLQRGPQGEMPHESVSPTNPNGGGLLHEPDYHGASNTPYPGSRPAAISHPLRSVVLLRSQDVADLPGEDRTACQNIEFFEVSPEQAAEYDATRPGGVPVTPGQVGLRCIHCARSPLPSAVYSVVFPQSLGGIASAVRTIADQHLCTCGMVPREVQEACDYAAAKRRRDAGNVHLSEIDRRNRLALSEYCIGLSHHLGITDKDIPKTGIVFVDTLVHSSRRPPSVIPAEMGAPDAGPWNVPQSDRRLGSSSMLRPGATTLGPVGLSGDPGMPIPVQHRNHRSNGRQFDLEDRGYAPPHSLGPPYGPGGASAMYEGGPERGYNPSQPYPPEPNLPMYDLPGNFPFYQEQDGAWLCKFCSHVHPQYKDAKAVWSSPSHGPPPGNFIDQHLSICHAYRQSGYPPMYSPPNSAPYGNSSSNKAYMQAPYGDPQPGWDGPSPQTIHPSQVPYGVPSRGEPLYSTNSLTSSQNRSRRPSDSRGSSAFEPSRASPAQQNPRALPPIPQLPTNTPLLDVDPVDDPAKADAINHLIQMEKKRNEAGDHENANHLVLDEDKGLLTDYFFYLMKQLQECHFGEADRKTRGGKREKIQIGYGGLQCVHCSDVPNSRKFFWSNVDRLANSFAEIPSHILKCRRCPQQTKDALNYIKKSHPEQMSRLARGSQKVFFRRMWRRLHPSNSSSETPVTPAPRSKMTSPNSQTPIVKTSPDSSVSPDKYSGIIGQVSNSDSPASESGPQSPMAISRSTSEAARLLAMSSMEGRAPSPSSVVLLATPSDREWLSDMDCFIRQQLEVFCADEDDVNSVKQERKYPIHVGQVGIRCIHCSMCRNGSGVATGTAVSFPYSISGIYESVREFQRLHMNTCENIPPSIKKKVTGFKGSSSLSSVLRKYYVLSAKALGLYDTRDGIKSGGDPTPVGVQETFALAEPLGSLSPAIKAEENQRMIHAAYDQGSSQGEYIEENRKRKAPPSFGEGNERSKDSRIMPSLSNLGEKAEV